MKELLNTQKLYIQYLNDIENLFQGENFDFNLLKQLKDQIYEQELLLPIIGAFSAGKSSLLNKFLGRDVLPVGIAPETELATELRYGVNEHILAIRLNGTEEKFDIDDFDVIKMRSAEFSHLKLYLNNEYLKAVAPFVVVDMPGFGSSLENHNKAINYYLPRGAHFVVVVSVEEGNITRSMLRQLQELQNLERNFMVLVSKVNLRAEHQVNEVLDLVSEQLQISFSNDYQVLPVGESSEEQFREILAKVEPEKIFKDIFIKHLKDLTFDILGEINIAKAAISNSHDDNERVIQDLSSGMQRIEEKRNQLIEDLQDRYSERVVNNCVEHVGRKLSDNIDELLVAIKNNSDLNQTIIEIVRVSFADKLKSEIGELSGDIIEEFNIELRSLNTLMTNYAGSEWVDDLSEKIKGKIEATNSLLTKLSETFSTKTDSGKVFKTIATVLAITTGTLAPLVELVIVFLPEIVGFFGKQQQQREIKNKIQSEIIPSIKRELRKELPKVINEQLNQMIENISESFETDLSQKREVIKQMQKERDEKLHNIEEEINRLDAIEKNIISLSENTIYA